MTGFIIGLGVGWGSAFLFWLAIFVATAEEDDS